MFARKFFLFSSSSLFITAVGSFVSKWIPFSYLDSNTLAKIHGLTENLHEVSLKPKLISDSLGSGEVKQKELYSLFSTNVDTFAQKFKQHFYTWALFGWAEALLADTSTNAFWQKQKIAQKFIELKNSFVVPEELTAKNWTRENFVISEAKETLEGIFKEVFFREIYVNSNDIGLGGDKKDQYGDGKYIKGVVDFQKFVFEEWLSKEKPQLICKRSWDYSSSFSEGGKIFKNPKGNKPSFQFPDFHSSKSDWQTFNKKLASGDACGDGDFKFVTVSDIAALTDGYELSAYLYRQDYEKPKYFSDSDSSTFDNKNPIEMFVPEESFLGTHKDSFKFQTQDDTFDDGGDLKDKKDKRITVFKDFKYKKEEGKYATYARTQKGLLFLYKNPDHKNLKDYLFKNDKYRTHGLADKLFEYFKKNGAELLGKHMSSDEGSIFVIKNWDSSLAELAKNISIYSSTLESNKKQWGVLKTLSTTVKEYLNIKFSAGKATDAGLAVPIPLKRNLDKTTEAKGQENDGKFEEVTKLFKESGETSNAIKLVSKDNETLESIEGDLRPYVRDIKKGINKYLNVISQKISIKKREENISFFLNDYIFDNIFQDFVKDKSLIVKTVKNIYLLNELDLSSLDINTVFKTFAERIASRFEQDKNKQKTWNDFFEESMEEIFLGESYLSENIEDRVNYGGYKSSSTSGKSCITKIKSISSGNNNNQSQQSESCTNEKKKHLQTKLKNYWTMKNYVYNGYGFDVSSFETNKLIKYLFSLNQLLKHDFAEFRKVASSNINPKEFGVLAWVDSVDKGDEIGKASGNGIESIDKYFRNSREDDIFNPFFSNQITIPTTDDRDKSLYSNNISAFAPTGENEKTEFFGFQGLVTRNTLETSFPLDLKRSLFNSFEKYNPKENKNYVASSSSNSGITGIAFGFLGEKGEGIDWNQYIDSLKTDTQALNRLLSTVLAEQESQFKSSVSDLDYSKNDGDSEINFQAKKELLKELIGKQQTKLEPLTKRFSGFLQNGTGDLEMHSEKKFFIPKEKSSSSGYVVYITQVNRHDFGAGFNDFLRVVGYRTLFKTIIMICSKDSQSRNITENFLLNENVNL